MFHLLSKLQVLSPLRLLNLTAPLLRSHHPIHRLFTTHAPVKPGKGHTRRRVPGSKPIQASASKILHEGAPSPSTSSIDGLISQLRPVTSVTLGDEFDFNILMNSADKGGSSLKVIVPDQVVLLEYDTRSVMILSNGTLVGWDVLESDLVSKIGPLVMGGLKQPCEYESEEMDYIVIQDGNNKGDTSRLQGELFVISAQSPGRQILDMAAFAIGFSRSTRLSILEAELEKHIALAKGTSMKLASGSRITALESDVLKLTGRLFLLRGKLNLYSELIETPDMYWSEPALEQIYEAVSNTLDINPRIAILNRKLDYATEEQRAFLSVLNEKKSTRLEWIIIILIMVEVTFEIHHFLERYLENTANEARAAIE